MSILIRQAKVVDTASPYHGKTVDIFIEKGKIISIEKRLNQKAKKEIAVRGLHVSPGFVDIFADYAEPGYEHKETIATGLATAAAGGFTHVCLSPNTLPGITDKAGVEFVKQKAAHHAVKLYPLGSITQGIAGSSLAEMIDMKHAGAIAFTDGWKAVQDANVMLKALEYVKSFDGLVMQIPVDQSISSNGLMHEGVISTRLGMAGIPVLAETIMLYRDIELLRYTQSKLHVMGVSTEEGVQMILKAKKEGLDISCSVTPYHLLCTEEAMLTYDSMYKVLPVLRSEKDRKALIKGLKDGTIDCITSHHRPQDEDAKQKEFEYAAAGMAIQELLLGLVMEAVAETVSLERVIDAITQKPRNIIGLPGAAIAEGANADISLFLPEGNFQITHQTKKSQAVNNPFLNKNLKGKILGIIHHHQSTI